MTEQQQHAIDDAKAMAAYLGADPAEIDPMAAKLAEFANLPTPGPVVSPLWRDILNNPQCRK